MRDRLIELISQVQYMGGLEGQLADYLLKNGVIVPPCKVGDKVYALGQKGHTPIVMEGVVVQLIFHKSNSHIDIGFDNSLVWDYHTEDFGRRLFFTRKEAEKAMERRKNGT